jgi:hypothetical protein
MFSSAIARMCVHNDRSPKKESAGVAMSRLLSKWQWVCVALLVQALAVAFPSTSRAISYLSYLLSCDLYRDLSKNGQITASREQQLGDDAYEEYKSEQRQQNVQIIGQVAFDGNFPHVIREEGSMVRLSFEFVDTTTGLPRNGPQVFGVVYDVNLDPSDQFNFVHVGVSFDRSSNFSLPFQLSGWEPLIRATPIDRSGKPVVITGLDGYNVAIGLGVAFYPTAQPIQLAGYNADVISDKDLSMRFAQPFDANTFAWFERGAMDDNGVPHLDGLPAGLTFMSVTGSAATYEIQPANGFNVLQLGTGQTGTLTLTVPEPYGRLAFLSSSGNGTPSSAGSGNINFADGSTQVFNFNVFDWCDGQGNFHPEAALPGPNGRAYTGPSGTSFFYDRECDFQVYETVVPIDPWHAGVPILSIDFTGAPDAFYSNIFGVSGQ